MTRPTWSGRRVTNALRHVLERDGDTCWLCGHNGATSLDHVLAASTHPHLEWEPTNWRPAHLGKAGRPTGCTTTDCTCPGNTGRRAAPWTAPSSRTW